jgi:hypothetical protein
MGVSMLVPAHKSRSFPVLAPVGKKVAGMHADMFGVRFERIDVRGVKLFNSAD